MLGTQLYGDITINTDVSMCMQYSLFMAILMSEGTVHKDAIRGVHVTHAHTH